MFSSVLLKLLPDTCIYRRSHRGGAGGGVHASKRNRRQISWRTRGGKGDEIKLRRVLEVQQCLGLPCAVGCGVGGRGRTQLLVASDV